MAILDVIRFDGLKSRDWLIYKHPVENIVTGGQLVVQEGQRAVFVKGGAIADQFEPGTYTLTTENLPILRTLIKLPFGGNTPFSAEVYFFNTTARLDIYWGMTDPLQLIDPKFHIKLRIRAFGQMNLRVSDGQFVFQNIIGGMQKADMVSFDLVKQYFRGMIVNKVKAVLAETIVHNGISALEISAKIEEISNQVLEKILPMIREYGFECTHFYIESINFPDEDFANINKILEDKAAFEIMGDNHYNVKRSFDVYEGAANNGSGLSGTFASMGVGTGVALGIGSSMAKNVTPPQGSAGYTECVQCHAHISEASKFCPVCGAKNESRFCCNCGAKLPAGANFCPACGAKRGDAL